VWRGLTRNERVAAVGPDSSKPFSSKYYAMYQLTGLNGIGSFIVILVMNIHLSYS